MDIICKLAQPMQVWILFVWNIHKYIQIFKYALPSGLIEWLPNMFPQQKKMGQTYIRQIKEAHYDL